MAEDRSQNYVQVQLSPEEKALIDAAAKAARLSRSTWMRLACLMLARRGEALEVNAPKETP